MSASRDGNGTFNRAYDWTDDAANSIPITASRFDTEMDGIASELTNSVAVDGQSTMSGNLKMGGFKVTGMANGAASTDAVTLSQVQSLIATAKAEAKAESYPIGSYYINETDNTNPATLLGFGTWTAITDRFIVARGSTYTSTGGAATVTLSVSNLPAHTHYSAATSLNGGGFVGADQGTGSSTSKDKFSTTGGTNTPLNITGDGSAQGLSGTPFSTIPPYQAAYIWKRTA